MLHKYHVEPGAARLDSAPPLAAIYLLETATAAEELLIEPIALVDAAPALLDNIYRRALGAHISGQRSSFARIARLLSSVQVYRLRRSLDPHALDRVVTRLRSHWNTLQ
jgi:hypothetical protein